MGEMGEKLGEMGNGRNGIGRNGNTPIRQPEHQYFRERLSRYTRIRNWED
jgi:hypothetical protein